ncbi:MAG: ABC transporter permease subunit [Lachnospiraceae bacterium]|nr:ABC transporter permease subunit [Lachnospiraceae bacterium]
MKKKNSNFIQDVKTDWKRNKSLYFIIIPVILFYILFMYKPMYGALIAFQDYSPAKGMGGSNWVGFKHFIKFFNSPYFFRLIRNTIVLSLYSLIFCFPAPIILALLLNEVKNKKFKSVTQTMTYLPHFISMVVAVGIIQEFCLNDGLINDIVVMFGGERSAILQNPKLYRMIYIVSDIWQQIGWGSIMYLAALAGVDQQLYEAASIDGAGKWKQILNVTIPGIMPTVIIMLILRIGSLMSMGYEKTILLYNPTTYETADIISSYVYRVGLLEQSWSYSTAIGLLNSIINCALLVFANKMSKRVTENSLW